MKKVCTLLLALLVFAFSSFSEVVEKGDWKINTEDYMLEEYLGSAKEIVIPEELEDIPVESIGVNVFNNKLSEIESITLPKTIRQIRSSSFSHMENLHSLTLNEGLLTIGTGNINSLPALKRIEIPSTVCCFGDDCFSFLDSIEEIVFKGKCPKFSSESFMSLPEKAKIVVPDDEIENYKLALSKFNLKNEIIPSGSKTGPENTFFNENDIEIDENGCITNYKGYNERLDIPDTIKGIKVRSIGDQVFQFHRYLAYVSLPEGLEEIGREAFSDTKQLIYINFPSTLKRIADRAFFGSTITNIELNEGLEEIGKEAFMYASFKSALVLPKSLKALGDSAFEGNPFTKELYIKNSETQIGNRAFANGSLKYLRMDGTKLSDVNWSAFADNTGIEDIDIDTKASKKDMLAIQEKVNSLGLIKCRVWRMQNPDVDYVNDNLSTYEGGIFTGYTGNQANIRPFDSFSGVSVTGIGNAALKGNQTVKYFSVPYNDEFTHIGDEAFAGSAIEKIDLFDSVTHIGKAAFKDCKALKEIDIPESVESIGENAFEGCDALEKITVRCKAEALPAGALSKLKSLKTLEILKGKIPEALAKNSPVEELKLGEGVSEIGKEAFFGTNIKALVIPAATVHENAFSISEPANFKMASNASDEQLKIASKALNYPWYDGLCRENEQSSFMKMPFAPNPESDFEFNKETGEITKYIGNDSDVIIPREISGVPVRSIAYGAFTNAEDYTETEVTSNKTEWLKIKNIVVPETVTSLPDSCFNYIQSLENFICYGPLETTGKSTFNVCRKLKNVVFVNGARLIDNYAFSDCRSLERVVCRGTADMLGQYAFMESGIKELKLNIAEISLNAFSKAEHLEKIHIGAGIEKFDLSAIALCPKLSELSLSFKNPERFISENFFLAEPLSGLTVKLPNDTSDEEKQAMLEFLKRNRLINDENALKTEALDDKINIPSSDEISKLIGKALIDVGNPKSAPNKQEAEQAKPAEDKPADEKPTDKKPAEEKPAEQNKSEQGAASKFVLDKKYLCTKCEMNGTTIDASMLGTEYSVKFNSDKSLKIVIAGADMPGCTWQESTIDGEQAIVSEVPGLKFEFLLTDTGIKMNYSGYMLLYYELEK